MNSAICSSLGQIMESSRVKRILFIDDEPNARAIVQTCLKTLGGWEVLLAASGEEGLAIAQTQQPDAILLDVILPRIDGLTILRQLQANPATLEIPVLFFTSRTELTEPHRYLSLGVKGAIAKPFNPLTLATQIASTLGWNQA